MPRFAPHLKRLAHVAGGLACVIAAALLVRRGLQLGNALGSELERIPVQAFLLAFLASLFGAFLLGVAWCVLVRLTAGHGLSMRMLLVGHLRAQVAKYLPGNVFHLAFRHVAAHRQGVSHARLGFALVLESVLVLAAAGMLGFGIATDPRLVRLAPSAPCVVWIAPCLALAAWPALSLVARRMHLPQLAARRTAPWFALSLAVYLVSFLASTAALRSLADTPTALPWSAWCGWLALAWAVGYVTPGAPAGLGLREAVLALGLAPVFGEAGALALALAYRLLTVASDGVLALAGFLLPMPGAAEPARDG